MRLDTPHKIVSLLSGMILLLCLSCGDHSENQTGTSEGYATIAFKILPPHTGAKRLTRAPSINCVELGIHSVSALVFNLNGDLIQSGGPWACELGEGVIHEVPAGQTARVVVLCLDPSGHTILRGESADIPLEPETVADAGMIETETFVPQLISPKPGASLNQEEGSLTLSWSGVPSASYYRVRVASSPDFSGSVVVDESVADALFSLNMERLETGLAYQWQVTAIDAYDNPGGASETGLFTVEKSVSPPSVNQKPSALIQSPAHGKTFVYGTGILFNGTGTDPEDGSLTGSSLVWRSDIDGQIGTDASFQYSALSLGSHTITLTATDSAGESASAAVSIIIQESPSGNQAPEAQILSPANNATYTQGNAVSFSGKGTDPEEVGLSGAALSWSSNIDGFLETGVGFTWTTLSPGGHTISLTATDSEGLSHTATVTITITPATAANTPPVAAITFPRDGNSYTEGEMISFSGTGQDSEDGSLTGQSLSWSADGNVIGYNKEFQSSALSVGSHTISLTATDSEGLSHTATVTITIAPTTAANTPPVAAIALPRDGASYTEGEMISFSGTGQDSEDGSLTSQSLSWSSDGNVIGYGQSFQSSTLSAGTHAITLTATDSGGLSHQTTVNITVNPAQAADMSGTWYYYTADNWSEGNCPTGSASQGTLTISQSGNSFTLVMSRMTFTGAIVDNWYACSNTTQIQGGTQTTTLGFQRQSDTSASGTSTTVATFTETSCQWGSSLYLYR